MNKTTIKNDRYQQDEVLSALFSADSVLLFCHISPDGDTLGSALALKIRLERLGKRVQVLSEDPVPEYLAFLPGASSILGPENEIKPYDLAVAMDVASVDRMGSCGERFVGNTAVVDHHGTNTVFGTINLIDADAPATALVLYRLFGLMDMSMTREEAICLYTALSTDTGNFIYDSTNAETFAMMSALMDAGLPLPEYSRMLFRQKEEAFVRLLAQVLPSLRVVENGLAAGLTLTLAQMEKAHATGGHTDGLVNYAIDIKGVKLAYFIREIEGGKVKASLRALEPYAVDGIAARLGGGGHKLAAGVTLAMPLQEAVAVIEQAFHEVLV